MGACARGAVVNGGCIIGVAPRFFDEPGILFQGCTELIFTETMSQRKAVMEDRAEAFIVLPGGIGTFEELFETLTLKQLGQHSKPMALVNTLDYFAPLLSALQSAAEGGFMSGGCLDLYRLCRTPAEALAHAGTAEEPRGSVRRLRDYTK